MDPTQRTLELLALLQSRPSWPAAELASRLGASPRTLRRDLTRLRGLGYAVEGRTGPGGSYALRPGQRIPPLLLEDDEVVALVAALRMAEGRLAGDAVERLLAKLTQLLPGPLARTATAVRRGSSALQRDAPDLDVDVLGGLSRAGAEDRSVRFSYVDQHGQPSQRHVDSVRCVHSRGQWYVVAFDLERDDWRLLRLDRVAGVEVATTRSEPRSGPADDLLTWFLTDFGRVPG